MFLNRHKKLFVSFSCLPKSCSPVTTQMTARRVVYVGSLIKLIRSFLFLPWPVACLWLAWHKQQTIQQQSITKRIVNAIAKNSPQSNSIFEKFPWLVSFHVNCSVSEGTSRTSSADEKINLISCFVAASAGGSNEYFFIMQTDVFIEKVPSSPHDISIHAPNYWVNEESETEIDNAHKSLAKTLVYWENKISNKFLAEIYSRIETEARSDGIGGKRKYFPWIRLRK